MPYTVWGAFDKFRVDTIDLNAHQSDQARSSRDYLFTQIQSLSANDRNFPKVSTFIPYGSFARKTKIWPLDDIDMLIILDGRNTEAVVSSTDPYLYWLKIVDRSADLARFPDDYGYVNSTKVLNQFKSSLSSIRNYRRADIKKTQQAVTLDLSSYPWVFDIVPAVPIRHQWLNQISYYLIPNGRGDWIRTDPRKDGENTTRVNQQHAGEFLPLVRLLKYWNRRTHKPRLMPYYFEALAIKVFGYAQFITDYPTAIVYFFQNCIIPLILPCPDPKGLGANLDADVSQDTKIKVRDAMQLAWRNASAALLCERAQNHERAISFWKNVFGPEFPTYG